MYKYCVTLIDGLPASPQHGQKLLHINGENFVGNQPTTQGIKVVVADGLKL